MNDLDVARDLRAAAGYLRVHGWLQGELGTSGGPRCALGALLSVTGEDVMRAGLLKLAMGMSMISGWNNEPWRTVDDVTDLFESTALALEVRQLAADKAVTPEPSLVGVA